jgi:hypothetical protein
MSAFLIAILHIRHAYWLVRERREHRVFNQLLQMIPGLKERLMDGCTEDIKHVGELVRNIFSPQIVGA